MNRRDGAHVPVPAGARALCVREARGGKRGGGGVKGRRTGAGRAGEKGGTGSGDTRPDRPALAGEGRLGCSARAAGGRARALESDDSDEGACGPGGALP